MNYRISPKLFLLFGLILITEIISVMVKFESSNIIVSDNIDVFSFPKGIKKIVINAKKILSSRVQVSIKQPFICLIFNFGTEIVVNTEGPKLKLFNREENNILFNSGEFELSIKEGAEWNVHLLLVPIAVYEHAIKHFDLSALGLEHNVLEPIFKSNLNISEEMSNNLYAINEQMMNSEGASVYIYGRLLVCLSLQFNQYSSFFKKRENVWLRKDALSAKILRVEQLIRSNLQYNQTIKDLAKKVGTNECYLKQHFKKTFGLPVFAYQTKLRMEMANNLLLNTTDDIESISKRLGYKYTTHFTAMYKKHYDVTPGELRRKMIGL